MIPEHMEPTGLRPDARPLADFRRVADDNHNAVTGSQKLLEALLKAQGRYVPPPPPKIKLRKRRAARRGRPIGCIKRRRRYDKIFRIQSEVAKRFRISAIDIAAGPTRANSEARQLAMFVARSLTDASYPDIARHFNRDHSTVMHAVKVVQAKIDAGDRQTIRDLKAVMVALGQ